MNIAIDSSNTEQDDLVKRVKTDREAFASLYDFYYPRILRYCSSRFYSQSIGEDLTSDIFLAAATKIATFRGLSAGEFSKWLYTIANNRINEYLRTFERRKRLLESATESKRIVSTETHDNLDHLDMPAVHEAILKLKERDQTLIGLRYTQDLPHDQIADIVGLKPGTVRVAISRAIEQLRNQFNHDQAV